MVVRRRHNANGEKETARQRPHSQSAFQGVAKMAEPVAPVALQRIMAAPRPVTPADVRVLQRTVGNRAVRRLVRPTLTILQVPPLQGGGRAGAASFSAAKAKAATHVRKTRGPYFSGALGAEFGYTDTEAVDAKDPQFLWGSGLISWPR